MEKSTSQIEKNVSASFAYVKKDMLMLNDAFSDMHDKIQHLSLNHAMLLGEVEKLRGEVVGKKKTPEKKQATPKKKEDLTDIEGIGPAIKKLLKDNKIDTFKKLANAKGSELRAILDSKGTKFQMHNPTTWAKQAKLASQRKWTELEKLQTKLNGGVTAKKAPEKKPIVKKVVKETVTYE